MSWIVLLKLAVQPALTFWLGSMLLADRPFWLASAVILSALPTGALAFVLAQRYEVYVQRSTSVILVSTVLSVLTLSGLLICLTSDHPGDLGRRFGEATRCRPPSSGPTPSGKAPASREGIIGSSRTKTPRSSALRIRRPKACFSLSRVIMSS